MQSINKNKDEKEIPGMNEKYISTKRLQEIFSLSRQAAERLGNKAEAKIKIGRSVRWNLPKIEEYLRRENMA